MRRLLPVAVLLLLALVAAATLFATPDVDPAAMSRKYGGPASRFLETPEGLKLHFRDEGNPDGATLVLLHGTNASLHTFAPVVERIGGEYRIITLDFPAHGLSGAHPRGDYSARGYMEAVDAVAEAAGAETFTLGGNSLGGWVSWRYALENPQRVEGLILIDAGGAPLRPGEEPPPLNLGFRLARNPIGRIVLERFTPRSLFEKSIKETVADPSIVDDAMIDRYWELARMPGMRREAVKRFAADREPDYAQKLKDVAAPTLIIWGDKDQLVYPSAATTFDEQIPNAEIVMLENVGHIPQEEAPEATANAIRRFMEQLSSEPKDMLAP
jgi:pimeloyl-ACP methyl ester carboxylesterase